MKQKKLRIAELLPEPAQIDVGNGKFLSLRPLTLKEIVKLLTKHGELLALFVDNGGTNTDALIIQSPEMAADIIARAADAEGEEEDIMKLPFAVQLTAIAVIWDLSVPDVKKLVESLSKVAATLKDAKPTPERSLVQ